MGSHPSRQHDLFEPPQGGEPLPKGVRTRLRPLLLALLMEAVSMNALAEPVEPASRETGDDRGRGKTRFLIGARLVLTGRAGLYGAAEPGFSDGSSGPIRP
jgi:hypothetical protein